MVKVEEGVIYLTRGDSTTLTVNVTDEKGNAYEMQQGDTITMTVREQPSTASSVVFAVTSDTPELVITPEMTHDAVIGQYSADVQLNTVDGHVYTIWPEFDIKKMKSESNWKNFWVTPEVTRNDESSNNPL